MKKTILFLMLSCIASIHIQSVPSQAKIATYELNEQLYRAFMTHDYARAVNLLAQGANAKEALKKCSEQTPQGLIVRRSIFGAMQRQNSWFSKKPIEVVSREKWLELLKPYGIVNILEYK